jgi:kinesin family protein 5
VVELEMQLDEVREQYKVIARSANSRAQQRKLEFLEHNLDALNNVQKQLVEQNTALKKEVGVAERKLIARNERIQNLESLLNDADTRLAQKNQRYESQLSSIRERLAEVQAQQHPSYNHARIAKPLRGGGGAAQPAVSVFSNNPLTRAQEESAASAKRRECESMCNS